MHADRTHRRKVTGALTGQTYGRWTVLQDGAWKSRVRCRCECGTERVVLVESLRNGRSRSCGCLAREMATVHGHNRKGAMTPTYSTWHAMRSRCEEPGNASYHHYGARGITVCERWLKFPNFLADMGERPDGMTLDRIDAQGNYEPGNCRWATPKQQAANRDGKVENG